MGRRGRASRPAAQSDELMTDVPRDYPMGDSPSSHEGTDLTAISEIVRLGTYLEPHKNDDEILTLTRRDLRLIVRTLIDAALLRHEARIAKAFKDHVHMETVQ